MEQQLTEEKEITSSFDIKRYFSEIISKYYWFLLTFAIGITGAYLYMRYTPPLYSVSTYILINLPNDASNALGGSPFGQVAAAAAGNGAVGGDASNEIFKLQSEAILGEVVDSLNLDMT